MLTATRYIQIYTDIYRYTQIYTNIHKYTQIYTNIQRYTQVYSDIQRQTWTFGPRGPTVWSPTVWGPICLEPALMLQHKNQPNYFNMSEQTHVPCTCKFFSMFWEPTTEEVASSPNKWVRLISLGSDFKTQWFLKCCRISCYLPFPAVLYLSTGQRKTKL